MTAAKLNLGGEKLMLWPDRCVWWEAQSTLLVADLHLGREIALRQLGVPVPHGATRQTLRQLAAVGDRLQAQRLVVLGDFFHSREAREPKLEKELGKILTQAFRERWLILGNHDRHAGNPPSDWEVQIFEEGTRLGPLQLFHHPPEADVGPALAGHWHPAFELKGPARLSLRLPAFCLADEVLVLPAFGEMTGRWVVQPTSGHSRCWVCADKQVREVSVHSKNFPPKESLTKKQQGSP